MMSKSNKPPFGLEPSPMTAEDLDDSLWDSPAKQPNAPSAKPNTNTRTNFTEQQERDEQLKQELASVRKVNRAIEGIIESLEKAKTNMKTVNQTVGAASALLNTWTRILSQTEHTQNLVLNPAWQGATQDVINMEEEAQAEQQAELRRAAEEEERRNNVARKAEEDEQRRRELSAKQSRGGVRGTSRVGARPGSSSSHNYVAVGGSTGVNTGSSSRGGTANRRTTSGISRGARGSRGRT